MFGRPKRLVDVECGERDLTHEVLDYDDASWVIDHHRQHLIEKISKPASSWYESLRPFKHRESGRITEGQTSPNPEKGTSPNTGIRREEQPATTQASSNNKPQENTEQSYRINLAELQRLRLRQLQRKLVQHAVDLRYDAREPDGWADNLRDYGEPITPCSRIITTSKLHFLSCYAISAALHPA